MISEPEIKFGTMSEMISKQAEIEEDNIFLTDLNSDESRTYAEVNAAANEVAKNLSDSGVDAGDKVSLVLENSNELVIAICGAQKIGAVAVPVNHEYTQREIQYILENSDSKAVITREKYSEKVENASNEVGINRIYFTEDGSNEFYRTETDASINNESVTPTDTAVLMFTSGTTGDPKGVALSHINLFTRFAGGSLTADGTYTFYTILPLYNIDGFSTTFATMYRGQKNVLKNGFSASEFWTDVEKYELNITSVVPSILAILMKRDYPDDVDISSFETFFVSGSYVHEELINEFENRFGIDVMEIYGLTEASGTSFASQEERKIGSCGYPNRYSELSVLDEDTGEVLPPDELGEIVIRGPTVFKEYYNNTAATEEVLDGGWFFTGDIGFADEKGRYHILDREKNIIIKGGQNIYPGEIEEIIHQHENVKDVAIVGEEDEIYGEIIIAYILMQADDSADKVSSEIQSLCKENLAEYKIPDNIRIVDGFPRGETGKILKEEL